MTQHNLESWRIGVISDTHGLVRPQALQALRDSNMIIHAGDVGGPEVLEQLRLLAPVTAVRGNIDQGAWADDLPSEEIVEAGGTRIYLIHDINNMVPEPKGWSMVVSGHSHIPSIQRRDGTIYLNPGSAGPKRFSLPVGVAMIQINKQELQPKLLKLAI